MLLAEDNALNRAGCNGNASDNGSRAVEVAENGLEAVKQIKARHTHSEAIASAVLHQSSVDDYMAKPFKQEDLLATVERWKLQPIAS